MMAVNEVLYHMPERRKLQDVLTAIRLKTTVAEAGLALGQNAERFLKPPVEMARLFRRHPDALAETLRFAATLSFSLEDLRYNYPDEPTEFGAAAARGAGTADLARCCGTVSGRPARQGAHDHPARAGDG